MSVEDWEDEQEPVLVWPDHVQAYQLFRGLETQWRVGMNGATGLDYNVLYRDLDRLGLTPERFDELRCEVQVIERAALEEMRKE